MIERRGREMTAQVAENLISEGNTFLLCTEPLQAWFKQTDNHPKFLFCTACWRGYVGTWKIIDGRLSLSRLEEFEDATKDLLVSLFPDSAGDVFADWFTGELRCPIGKMLSYVHRGYDSRYEQDWFINLKDGVVIGERYQKNELIKDSDGIFFLEPI